MRLVPDERLYAITVGNSGTKTIAMLPDASHEIIGYSDVKCSIPVTRKNVNKEYYALRPWIPAYAGMSGKETVRVINSLRSFPRKRESSQLKFPTAGAEKYSDTDNGICHRNLGSARCHLCH